MHHMMRNPVRALCFMKEMSNLKINENIRSPSLQLLMGLVMYYCGPCLSGWPQGSTGKRKKTHFVCITVSLRHGKAYGKYSYVFPGVSLCVTFISVYLRT